MGILGLAVACGDDARRGKPYLDLYSIDLYSIALRKLGAMEASTCMAVGTSPYDAMAARTAGLHAAGVLTGGFSPEELIGEGCELVLDRAIDLPEHLPHVK